MTRARLAEGLAGEGLPSPAADRVAESVAASRLTRREADEVARELSAHFEDGLARGRALDDLLREFGDPALAGPLIGASVRRRRRAGRHTVRLAEAFTALVLAAYLVSFARLHARAPEAAMDAHNKGSRHALLAAWSGAGPSPEAEIRYGRSRLAAARDLASRGLGSEAAGALLDAVATARAISAGPSPSHELAALRLAAEAASAAVDLPAAHSGDFSPSARARMDSGIAALRTNPIAWRPEKVRAAFHDLASSMYTAGEGGRLTAAGLRLYQAWKGKTRPGLQALLLEPAYFANPARRGEAVAELDRFLDLAGGDPEETGFERERRLFEASSWRTLRYAPLQIPLDHVSAARDASRALARALNAVAAAEVAERRS